MRGSMSAPGVLVVVVMLLLSAPSAWAQERIISSEDGVIRVSIPEGWVKSDVNKKKDRLQVKDPENEYYVLFLYDSKSDLDTNLKDYAKGRCDHIVESLKNGSATEPKAVKVGENTAIQYEISGSGKETGVRLKYLFTVVETKTAYVQCMGWSIASKYGLAKPELEKVTQGLTEKSK